MNNPEDQKPRSNDQSRPAKRDGRPNNSSGYKGNSDRTRNGHQSRDDKRRPNARDGKRPYQQRDGERRPYDRDAKRPYDRDAKRPYDRDNKRPYEKRDGDRPYQQRDGERRPYNRDGGKPYDRDNKRPYEKRDGDRPYQKRDGERRPYDRDNKRPYEKRDGDRPYQQRDGERRPYDRDNKRPYQQRDGERRPYNRDGAKPYDRDNKRPYERDNKRPYEKRDKDRPYQKRDGERRPYDRDSKRPYDRDDRRSNDRRDNSYGSRPRRFDDDRRDSRPPQQERTRGPEIPDDITPEMLPFSVRVELKTLSKENADQVARHLVMAAAHITDKPELANEHAQAAVARAGRVAVVRETAAITAYTLGDYTTALRELRTQRRISGNDSQIALIVDSERGAGRPEKALEEARSVDRSKLDRDVRVELAIAVSGAYLDLGKPERALVELDIPEMNPNQVFSWSPGLFAAKSVVLEELGRTEESAKWARLAEMAEDAWFEAHGTDDEFDEVVVFEEELPYDEDDELEDEIEAAEIAAAVAVADADEDAQDEAPAGDEALEAELAAELDDAEADGELVQADIAEVPVDEIEAEVQELLADAEEAAEQETAADAASESLADASEKIADAELSNYVATVEASEEQEEESGRLF